jgi:hypothetical protein
MMDTCKGHIVSLNQLASPIRTWKSRKHPESFLKSLSSVEFAKVSQLLDESLDMSAEDRLAWRNWRYRRATLARMLARDGMMQQVAEAYAAARAAH